MQKIIAAVAAALAAITLLVTQPALAQAKPADDMDMQALRAAVKSDKRALVAATLALTDAQARKFWPIYDTYQRSMDTIERERAVLFESLLSRDTAISNLAAKDIAKRTMQADEAEMRARRKMYKAVMRALPAGKAARYLQLEQKIRAMHAYDVAEAFPLVK